jgi:hypothetical protein
MKPRPTTKFTITVEVEADGDAEILKQTIAGQLIGTDAFFDDFGYDAWGGYEGPFLVACTVRDESGEIIAHHEQRDPDINKLPEIEEE